MAQKSKRPSRKRPASITTPSGRSLPELGAYVVIRPRADGTFRVLFEVPARLRPSGWPSTRPLPVEDRRGDLDDDAEVERIRVDAARFLAELEQARSGAAPAPSDARTLHTLIADLRRSQAFKDNAAVTLRGYEYYLRRVEAWANTTAGDPTEITAIDIESFLEGWDDRPTDRYHLRKVLRMVMQQAVRRKWRTDNPVDEVQAPMPKTKVAIWEQEDVDTYVWAALAAGNPDMAALILTEWEIGQRLTDVVLFRRGRDYLPNLGAFVFQQSKTDEPVYIPVSPRLQAILAHIEQPGSMYLFHDTTAGRNTASDVLELLLEGQALGQVPTALAMAAQLNISDVAVGKALRKLRLNGYVVGAGRDLIIKRPNWSGVAKPFADFRRLSHVFADIRDRFVIPAGGPKRLLRALRHSCVVALARCSCEIPEIASITGHSPASAADILRIYLPRDSTVAMNAQRKRGLIA